MTGLLLLLLLLRLWMDTTPASSRGFSCAGVLGSVVVASCSKVDSLFLPFLSSLESKISQTKSSKSSPIRVCASFVVDLVSKEEEESCGSCLGGGDGRIFLRRRARARARLAIDLCGIAIPLEDLDVGGKGSWMRGMVTMNDDGNDMTKESIFQQEKVTDILDSYHYCGNE